MCLSFMSCGGKHGDASGKGKGKPEGDGKARVVESEIAESTYFEKFVHAVGSLAPIEEAVVATKVPGRIARVYFDIGTIVIKGERLMEMESQDYDARLRQSKAMLDQSIARLGLPADYQGEGIDLKETSLVAQAEAILVESRGNLERVRTLSKEGVVSQSELDSAEAAYEVALNRHREAMDEARSRLAMFAQRKAEYDMARHDLDETIVYAPFDGIVQSRSVWTGEFVSTGDPVARIVRSDILRLKLEVSERDSSQVRLGQEVILNVTGDDQEYYGKIHRLSPRLNELTRMLTVEAEVMNPGTLRAGQFASTRIIITKQDPATSVSQNAMIKFAGIEKVVVIEDGVAKERRVETSRKQSGRVEITKGLQPGERVVINPGSIRTGQKVVDQGT